MTTRRAGRTAELVARVAAVIPTPGDALCADDPSWAGFAALLDAAADLLADALGTERIGDLCSLLSPPDVADDAVRALLVERTLDRLISRGH
jgi:hypothetical protein